jgi:monovalent cation:H+ antiporter-2, CPA2 family
MIEVTLLLVAAAVAFGISRGFRTPVVPLLIGTGYVLSAFGLTPDRAFVEQLLELGLSFLFFVAGMELHPGRMAGKYKTVFLVGILQFLILGGAGLAISLSMGFDVMASLYVGLAIAASSTLVVMRLLRERQQMFEPFGRLVIAVLLLQDILVITLMVAFVQFDSGWTGMAMGALATGVMILAVMGCAGYLAPWLIRKYEHEEEILLLSILTILAAFIGGAVLFEMPYVAGAFFAGVAISPFPVGGVARGLLSSLTAFFTAFFFTAFGAILVIPPVIDFAKVLILAALVIVVTPFLVATIAERAGYTGRNSIEAGLILAQTSEFSLIVGLQGLVVGHITDEIFVIIALVTVLTMVLTPWLATERMAKRLLRFHPAPRGAREAQRPHRDHCIILGLGASGRALLVELTRRGMDVVAVDHDPLVVSHLKAEGYEVIWGDATDRDGLKAAGVEVAKFVIVTTGRLEHLRVVRDMAPKAEIYAHIFDSHLVPRAEELDVKVILYSEAAVEDFMAWFNQRFAVAS